MVHVEFGQFHYCGFQRQPGSANVGWRNPSFQAYADYKASAPFLDALDQLVIDAGEQNVAVMCSESVWWRCHRRLIWLYATNWGERARIVVAG